jgi:hypothetical protein
VWREFDGFYVLYTAAVLKMAKGMKIVVVVTWQPVPDSC